MTSYNRVIVTGRVATSPRRRYRLDGSPVIQFPLELNNSDESSIKPLTRDGKRQALSHYGSGHGGQNLIDIVAFGELAELKFDLLQGGQHILVVGRLNQRHWQTPEGKKCTRMEIIATDLRKLEERNELSCLPADERNTL